MYTIHEAGNNLSGDYSLTEVGYDRYGLLEQFDNIGNNGGAATPGHMQYHPFGGAFTDEVADKTEDTTVIVQDMDVKVCKVDETTTTSKYRIIAGSDSFQLFGAREPGGTAAAYHGVIKYTNVIGHEIDFGACLFPAGRNGWLISADQTITRDGNNNVKSKKYTELNWVVWTNYQYDAKAAGGFAEDMLRLQKRFADPKDLSGTLDKLKDLILKYAKDFSPDPNAKKDGNWLPSRFVMYVWKKGSSPYVLRLYYQTDDKGNTKYQIQKDGNTPTGSKFVPPEPPK